MREFETMALAMIYASLPSKIQKNVMLEVLRRCGFKFSLEDLTEEAKVEELPKLELPVYRPKIYCPFCGEALKEITEKEDTPNMKAKLYDKHLDACPVWKVFEKHKRR